MQLTTYTLQIIIGTIGSFAFGALITAWMSKRKMKAETQLAIAETYSALTGDLREQVRLQGEQILLLQKKETEYLKIINNHQKVERELRNRVKELEDQVKNLQTQLS